MTVRQVDATYERQRLFQTTEREDFVLHDIDLDVFPREVLAVVGESGSGKSTLARVMAGLHPSLNGSVTMDGETLPGHSRQRTKEQLRRVQIIFQSPDQSLNPEKRIDDAIGRPLELYFGMRGSEKQDRIAELLEMVGLDGDYAGRFPAELSGGQRQRVSIARAFAAKPDVILCDEVLSALDTVVASRVLELMKELREKHKVAYVFISHDLSTVASIADRVAVMYAGRIIDAGLTKEVFAPPHHPYTQLLINSVPALRQGWLEEVIGSREAEAGMRSNVMLHDVPCPFRMRCPVMIEGKCDVESAPRRDMGEHHVVYCQHSEKELFAAQEHL
jgi:peptide/nickel transport system ATP-binding protein